MQTPLTLLDDSSGKIQLYPDWFKNSEELFAHLKVNLDWQSRMISLFGKSHLIPRLENWQSIKGVDYRYSSQSYIGSGLPQEFQLLCKALLQQFSWEPNSVLSNFYRNGADTMGWHSDNEPELGLSPKLSILSLGAPRDLLFRRCDDKTEKIKAELTSGSLLFMTGDVQTHWQHSLPRRVNREERISCTFRKVIT
jgi:alkylated DNA repair dioxygenase AlkB